ncbi:uncharacterized protein LOC125485406 isoform X2 [Rhincodon typus]|uniref:uncharacterized protein LOC125485406 isoform X2 n=1 Tax=Rhincodon typus TaxID=259920 RepID=UPI00202FA8D6|nr:uncharacterized protein LOC125485406 isoform X2 [Rhincodon typus]
MRLSSLDHPSCDHQQETHQLQKHLPQTMGAESQEKIASGETGELDRSGFSAQHPSGNSSECKPGPAHQSNQEDMRQNSQTMMSDPLNNKAANVNGLKQSTRDRNPQCFNREALSPKETSVPEDVDHFISTESMDMEGEDSPLSSVVNFLEKYCIFNREELALYKKKFKEVDKDNDGYLTCVEVIMALKEMVTFETLTDSEEIYIYRILESLDCHFIEGFANFQLFAVMVSLARKITKLEGFMRSLIGNMDFKALELRIDRAKQLFLCNLETESTTISVQQFLVELKAGGISRIHEEEVRRELQHTKALDLLDFLTYLPLFVLIHNSVITNPLDDSQKL